MLGNEKLVQNEAVLYQNLDVVALKKKNKKILRFFHDYVGSECKNQMNMG